MQKKGSNRAEPAGLFRHAAVKAAGLRLFGDVCIAMPPAATVSAVVGAAVTLALVFVLWAVEVPTRINATGMLMPPSGLLDVVAPEAGQVEVVHTGEQRLVRKGERLLELVAHGRDTSGRRASMAELQSLRDEYELLDEIFERRRAVFLERRNRLARENRSAQQQMYFAERRVAESAEKVAVLEGRLEKLRSLSAAGHVARDAIDREALTLLDVEAAATDANAALSAARLDVERIASRDVETRREFELASVEHDLRRQQLLRAIRLREDSVAHTIVAPRDGRIVRVLARPGMQVRKNQPLAKVIVDQDRPEAWIYVASGNARHIEAGESVELQFDAWPAAQFGTLTATVDSVSAFALGPAEIPVPLPVGGPVFEIRASIASQLFAGQALSTGTTFKAQIVTHRYRLYQWLTKHLQDRSVPDRA